MRKAFYIFVLLFSLSAGPLKAQIKVSLPSFGTLHDQTDTLELCVIGDVMMHSRQLEYDCAPFLAELQGTLKGADIAVANLEFALGGEPYSGYPAFSTPDYYPEYLAKDCGIDVFLCANNHILDRGSSGLSRTLGIYRQMSDSLGIRFTGIASEREEYEETFPLIVRAHGIRIAIINFTYGNNLGPQSEWPKVNNMKEDDVHAAFEKAKDKGADFIVAIPHWGIEYQLRHSAEQERWASWLVDEGADVVVGGHPHVVQDTTHIKGVPVIYSLGNAVSNMSIINSRLELAVTLRFVMDRASGRKRMLEPQLDFMWCTLPGTLTDSYATIYVKEWANRRDDWLTPSDFDNMIETWRRVRTATGIED